MMNIGAAMKLKGSWEKFVQNHPKFPLFVEAAKKKGITEGTVIAISVTGPDGKTIETNVRLTASDMELFDSLKDLS